MNFGYVKSILQVVSELLEIVGTQLRMEGAAVLHMTRLLHMREWHQHRNITVTWHLVMRQHPVSTWPVPQLVVASGTSACSL